MTGNGAGRAAGRVAPNSIAAYRSLDLPARPAEAYDAIYDLHREGWRPCDSDIAARPGWPVSWVTPRRLELEHAGRIVRAGDKIGQARRRVAVWKPASAAQQGELL